jgi:hypothetical protein
LVCAAQHDFFPIEGTRQTFAELERIYAAIGASESVRRVETDARHGLSIVLREAAYAWFERWLKNEADRPQTEFAVTPRAESELLVCNDGQANVTLKSRPLLAMAYEQFQQQHQLGKEPTSREQLAKVLRLHGDTAQFRLTEVARLARADQDLIVLVNGVGSADWQQEDVLLRSLTAAQAAVTIVDPRGVGQLRVTREVKGHAHADPLAGVEANVAYNAFLIGDSLLGMRVSDVLATVTELTAGRRPRRIVIAGRRDAGLVCLLATALDTRIERVAIEDTRLSYLPLFEDAGMPINAAEIAPALLRDFGDLPEVLASIAPRQVLAASCSGTLPRPLDGVQRITKPFSADPRALLDWLA